MLEDEDTPRRKRLVEQPVLDSFGIEELRDYTAELRAEIARAEAAIARTSGHRDAVDALFGKKTGAG